MAWLNCTRGVFGLVLAFSLWASSTAMATDANSRGLLEETCVQIANSINICYKNSAHLVRTIRNYGTKSRANFQILLLLGISTIVMAQSQTECIDLLYNAISNNNATSRELEYCLLNNTVLLEKIKSNTNAASGIDASLAYFYTVFGGIISAVAIPIGVVVTAVFDFGSGYYFYKRAEKRFEGINTIKEDNVKLKQENRQLIEAIVFAASELHTDLDKHRAKEKIEEALEEGDLLLVQEVLLTYFSPHSARLRGSESENGAADNDE